MDNFKIPRNDKNHHQYRERKISLPCVQYCVCVPLSAASRSTHQSMEGLQADQSELTIH
jgi:hypothetical protein